MFRPVKLFRITIQVPEKYMSDVMGVLGDFRLLHLININETHLGKLGYVAEVRTDLLSRYQKIIETASRLIKEISVKAPPPPIDRTPRPEKDIFFLEEELSKIFKEIDPIIKEGKHLEKLLRQKKELCKKLKLIEPAGIDFTRLSGLTFTEYRFGIMPPENLDKLEESLSDIHHALVKIQQDRERLIMAAFCLKEDAIVLDRALKSAFFNEIELPSHLTGLVSDVIRKLQEELNPIKDKIALIQQKKDEAKERFGQRLLAIREKAVLARTLLKAVAKFGKIDHTYLLTGWVPVNTFEQLRDAILEVTNGQALIDAVDPEDIREIRSGIIKIPILFNNPLLIRPFEKLTSLYGIPSYEEVEPTVFLAITFVVLFGMMFGDAGHGLVLFIVGFSIFKRLYKYMDLGIILMECGVSSMIFGLLYGSVFGLENIIPALWLHPMKDVNRFLFASIILGVAIISLGFILNLINILKSKDYKKLFTAGGLTGALLYWLLAGLAIRYLTLGPPGALERLIAEAVAALLLFIIIIERPLRFIIRHKKQKKKTAMKKKEGGSLAVLVFESFIEALDNVLRFLANTISFVRVAAFAITHAALFVGVFSIADMVSHGTQKGIGYIITLVIGNIVIIVLEAMVVSIQTVRLEYYEFFSKFFRGGGMEFRPILKENAENDS